MAVWVEDLTKDSFKVCLREVKIFDGIHKVIKIVSKVLYLAGVSAQNLRDTYSPFWTMYHDGVCNAPCTMMGFATQEYYWLKSFKTRVEKQTFSKIQFIY